MIHYVGQRSCGLLLPLSFVILILVSYIVKESLASASHNGKRNSSLIIPAYKLVQPRISSTSGTFFGSGLAFSGNGGIVAVMCYNEAKIPTQTLNVFTRDKNTH